jgi:sulfonate transport system substrate-binding protein
MRVRNVLASLAIAASALFALSSAANADPVKIRIAWMAVPTNLPPILFANPDVAKHLGQSYVMEPIRFPGSSPMITALAADQLDVGLLGYSTFALAVENAGMSDLRVVADDFQDGVPGYFTDHFLVLKDSPIKTIEDLKGKVLATNSIGGGNDIAMRIVMRKHGMEDKRDFTIVEVGLPNMKAVLGDRKVDLVPGMIPFSLDPEMIKISRTLFIQRDTVGVTQVILWAARTGYLQAHRAAMVDFMEDVVRARRFYLDPANHDEAVGIVAGFTKQSPSLFEWAFTKEDTYRDPWAIPNLDAMEKNIHMAHELGFIKDDLDVKRYADLSIVEEAGKRLK